MYDDGEVHIGQDCDSVHMSADQASALVAWLVANGVRHG